MRKKKHKNILFYRKAVRTSVIFDDSGRGLRPIKTKAEQQAEKRAFRWLSPFVFCTADSFREGHRKENSTIKPENSSQAIDKG